MSDRRIAVVLFNLGGPDNLAAVRPFLFNLFSDRAIITLPNPFRWLIAQLISRRRAPIAREIYQKMGGGSPILPNTEQQAAALTAELRDIGTVRSFICMRYWAPMTEAVVQAVKDFAPDEIILLPLYPQFSTTTTASSYRLWQREAQRQGLVAPTKLICCYPTEPGFIAALARGAAAGLAEARRLAPQAEPLIVFSAHGLPKKIVDAGDPYVTQVEAGVAAVASALSLPDHQWITAFQSRVGPLEWVGPATDNVIRQAADDGRSIVVVPVAFVSEHSETLVELDIEYRHLAEEHHAAAYVRVPTVNADAEFIAGLGGLIRAAVKRDDGLHIASSESSCLAGSRCIAAPAG
ncbi:MAG TPA: ferrochelatase [Dongiaceae bacterium]|nr:ferrochelatase [Dongiaceae bacterium]